MGTKNMVTNYQSLCEGISDELYEKAGEMAEELTGMIDELSGEINEAEDKKKKIQELISAIQDQLEKDYEEAISHIPKPRGLGTSGGYERPPRILSYLQGVFPSGGPDPSALKRVAMIMDSHWIYSEDDLSLFTVEDLDAMGLPMLLSRKIAGKSVPRSHTPIGARFK